MKKIRNWLKALIIEGVLESATKIASEVDPEAQEKLVEDQTNFLKRVVKEAFAEVYLDLLKRGEREKKRTPGVN